MTKAASEASFAPPIDATRRPRGRHRGSTGLLRTLGQRHGPILSNASSLFGCSLITSLIGFVFWWLAARMFPPSAVGYGSAAVSAMTLLGTFGMLGLGTVLIGELARRPRGSGGLVSAALIASGTAGAVLAVGFVLVAPHLSRTPVPFAADGYTMALFALAVVVTSVSAVLDEALVGLLLGKVDLQRNVIFCLAKLLALYLLALVVHDRFGVSILLAWTLGAAFSLLPVIVLLRLRGRSVLHAPQWGILRRLTRAAASHNWLNLALQSPQTAIPIVATWLVSATAGGSFYAVWVIVTLAYMVPNHLSTVLYAVGAADNAVLGREIRFTLRLSLLAGLIGVPALLVCASPGLHLFGATYAEQGTLPLRLLALGYFPVIFKIHYVAVCRVRGRITRAAVLITIGSLLELSAAVTGAINGGLIGLSLALLIAMFLEGLLTIRTVLRAAFAHLPSTQASHHPPPPSTVGTG